MSYKIVTELTAEQLVDIARGAQVEKVIEKTSEAGMFIYEMGIHEGRGYISYQLVYYTYKEWIGRRKKPQSKRNFFKDFNKIFTPNRDRDGVYYLLNPKPFDTSEEKYWLIKSETRKEKKANKTK